MIILDFTGLLLLKNRLNSVYAKVSYIWIGILSDKSAFSLVIVMLRDEIVTFKIIKPLRILLSGWVAPRESLWIHRYFSTFFTKKPVTGYIFVWPCATVRVSSEKEKSFRENFAKKCEYFAKKIMRKLMGRWCEKMENKQKKNTKIPRKIQKLRNKFKVLA